MGRKEKRNRRRGVILAAVLALLAFAAIALLVARPVRVTGVSQDALQASVARETSADLPSACEEIRGGRWRCVAGSGGDRVAYLVSVDDWGCWDARGSDATEPAAACIWARDFFDIE